MSSWFFLIFFFFKQKTAYEMRISDWSSDVCSSDLDADGDDGERGRRRLGQPLVGGEVVGLYRQGIEVEGPHHQRRRQFLHHVDEDQQPGGQQRRPHHRRVHRSEEHTSELQSLMRTSYAVFCLKKKINHDNPN